MSRRPMSLKERLAQRRLEKEKSSAFDAAAAPQQKDLAKGEEAAAEYMDALEDDTLASLNRTIGAAAETTDTGDRIVENLAAQGKQIDKAHKDLHEINEDLDQANHKIKTISSWKGMIGNWFRKKPKKKNYKGYKDQDANKSGSQPTPQREEFKTNVYQKREGDDKQAQIDGQLDNLMGHLGKMHLQAKDIGNTIDDHNRKLREVDDAMDKVNNKVTDQTGKLNRILRK